MASLFLISFSFTMMAWVIYQMKRCEAYGPEGFTQYNKSRWLSRKNDFFLYWYTIFGEASCSIYVLYAGFTL